MRQVQVQPISLDKLVAAPINANKMPPEVYARLVTAMKRLGVDLQPALVRPERDSTGAHTGRYEIIDGHHRVDAAREAGATDILCVVCELSDEEARVLGLGMNRVRGELDLGLASEILVALPDSVTHEVLALSGFSDDELKALLDAGTPHDPDPMGDALDSDPDPAPGGKFVLEVEFNDHLTLARARRGLRRAAGKGGTLAQGVLNLLEK